MYKFISGTRKEVESELNDLESKFDTKVIKCRLGGKYDFVNILLQYDNRKEPEYTMTYNPMNTTTITCSMCNGVGFLTPYTHECRCDKCKGKDYVEVN